MLKHDENAYVDFIVNDMNHEHKVGNYDWYCYVDYLWKDMEHDSNDV